MEGFSVKIAQIESTMSLYGREWVIAFAAFVFGLILIKWINKGLKRAGTKVPISPAKGATIRNVITVLMAALLITSVAIYLGVAPRPVMRFLIILTLAAIGMIMVFRPLIPTLPFKVGNTIMAGDLLGKVEATSLLNTRLKTFDGKTVFVPNRKILDDIVINYHFTPTRRFELKINILYDQDLMKAKQILETIMVEDPRVHPTPRPIVYLMSLNKGYVELSGRGWADNLKRFVITRELLEKIKLRFDQEGITLAMPQMQVHYTSKNMPQSHTEG
ncbi:MAG: mechanosensitive ion channel family protein [Desulfobacteraceae bacterium]|nr:mechanosensitive ion channel family protein [Desulfobacteraceae bacterium]MDH3572245.1 mechanosensitive ion channel family protein [Desulfobacteraceae bacterium]MDH3835859.1 mechanosensitive ion channel family protein [Desulfobacteraceae bacterium]MDH3880345.1 mechanosensitive ion channel family protein [Desulfobacteraceae bacterium]